MQVDSYNSNLAYDLSRFDVAEQQEELVRRQEKQEKAKQEIRMNSRSVSRSGSRVKAIACVSAVFAALCLVNVRMTTADDWARKVTEQRELLTAAQEENSLLQSRLDSKVKNIGYIDEYATEVLGMAKVSNSQIKHLSVNTESLIEVTPDGNDTIFETVSDWFSDLMEYIGL